MSSFEDNFKSIPGEASKTVSFRPLSGLINCGKLIPLQYAPITIELEVGNDIAHPLMSNDDYARGINSTGTGTANLGARNNSVI